MINCVKIIVIYVEIIIKYVKIMINCIRTNINSLPDGIAGTQETTKSNKDEQGRHRKAPSKDMT